MPSFFQSNQQQSLKCCHMWKILIWLVAKVIKYSHCASEVRLVSLLTRQKMRRCTVAFTKAIGVPKMSFGVARTSAATVLVAGWRPGRVTWSAKPKTEIMHRLYSCPRHNYVWYRNWRYCVRRRKPSDALNQEFVAILSLVQSKSELRPYYGKKTKFSDL